jgi:hypothetical protein
LYEGKNGAVGPFPPVGDGGVVVLDGRDGDACGVPLPTLTKLTCGASAPDAFAAGALLNCCGDGNTGADGACCPG